MTGPAATPAAIPGFTDKWHARWPEWNVARVFVPATQRATATAWFALLQEWTDAAWDGNDPTPGAAKLGWWQEELQGWSRGARRHPLGTVLQARPLPWASLAAVLGGLQVSRERPRDADEAHAMLHPFAQVAAQCEAVLFPPAPVEDVEGVACVLDSLLGEHALRHPRQAVPVQWMARHAGTDDNLAAARAWAVELHGRCTTARNPRPRRIHAAIVRSRLQGFASTGNNTSLPAWRIPILAWAAARRD